MVALMPRKQEKKKNRKPMVDVYARELSKAGELRPVGIAIGVLVLLGLALSSGPQSITPALSPSAAGFVRYAPV